MADELYTGPPIGGPPEHVHEETGVDDVLEETDELLEKVIHLEQITGQNHTELLTRIETCQTRLEALSTMATAENPMLAQVISQLTEIQAELLAVKSSMEQNLRSPEPNVLIVETPPTETIVENAPEVENQTVEVPDGLDSVENPPEPVRRKNRFI